jgi:hypothetical protein
VQQARAEARRTWYATAFDARGVRSAAAPRRLPDLSICLAGAVQRRCVTAAPWAFCQRSVVSVRRRCVPCVAARVHRVFAAHLMIIGTHVGWRSQVRQMAPGRQAAGRRAQVRYGRAAARSGTLWLCDDRLVRSRLRCAPADSAHGRARSFVRQASRRGRRMRPALAKRAGIPVGGAPVTPDSRYAGYRNLLGVGLVCGLLCDHDLC